MGKSLISLLVLFLISAPVFSEDKKVDKADLDAAIKRSVDYMVKYCGEDGQFAYRQNLDPKVSYKYKYNMLRHSGAVYSLGMAYSYCNDERIPTVIKRANSFLRKFIYPVKAFENSNAVWTIPEKMDVKAPAGSQITAKLGGSGLALLAFLADRTNGDNPATLGYLEKLGNFITFMQEPDGEFHSKYIDGKSYDDLFVSLYYPGEAMLGLLSLYEKDSKKKWLVTTAFGMHYIISKRKKTGDYPADHWILLASNKLLPKLKDLPEKLVTEKEVLEQADTICRLMISQQILRDSSSPQYGSFRDGGMTCPTAIRIEGMLAAYSFLRGKGYDELRSKIFDSCSLAINFLIKAQVKDGPFSGGMPRGVYKLPGNSRSDKADNKRMDEIRIDYVQHALSAFVMYAEIKKNDK